MFRNKEFRRVVMLFFFIAAISVTLGFIINKAAGVLTIISATAFGTIFFVYTKTRYDKIAHLSEQIDLVLHNADRLELDELDEGELSILYSEIRKMTMRIREQNDALKREKTYLADSLADIAHQLRTPLTSVNLLLSLLANSVDENERKLFLREIEELLVRMDWLITSLLKLSRLDAGVVAFQSNQIDVNSLIYAAFRPFQILMELHDIDVQIEVPKKIIIQGDFAWLTEAIQNIVKNCIESIGKNGKIEVVCVDTLLFIEIIIHDSGLGFEKEELPHIFDRFYRGKSENASGYGIGLALCQMIISRQGGTITAKNHPRGGAIFAIRFPK